jgi:hypothetical protein
MEIKERVLNRTGAIFGYLDFLKAKYSMMCCCCCSWCRCYRQRMKVKAGQDEALGRLEQEVDILNFIEASRIVKLLTSVMLRSN